MRSNLGFLLITNRITWQSSYIWPNLLITMGKTPAIDIRIFNSTWDITYGFLNKKTSTFTLCSKKLIRRSQTLKILWLPVGKIFNLSKNSSTKLTTKQLSPIATYSTRKFGWIVNTSKSNAFGNWKQSFLSHFKFFIR